MNTLLSNIDTGFIQRDEHADRKVFWFWIDGYERNTDLSFAGESYGLVEYKESDRTALIDSDGELVNPEGFEMTPEGVTETVLRHYLTVTDEMRNAPADLCPQDTVVRLGRHREYVVLHLEANGYRIVDTLTGQHHHLAQRLLDQRIAAGLYEIRSA